nr:MAG TPA: hypothetical protein [Caudoviricetes sp.]
MGAGLSSFPDFPPHQKLLPRGRFLYPIRPGASSPREVSFSLHPCWVGTSEV